MKSLPPLLALAAVLAGPGGLSPRLVAADDVTFNRDVRPILSEHCFACHGFDAKARKAKLRLDVPDGAFAGRKGVVPVKPGDPKASEVWARVTASDPDVVMPPPHFNKAITPAQKETLRKWIEQGAKYQKHWAFEPPVRSAVPQSAARNPVDAFLNQRLAKEGLTANGEADKETLIRRVAFALTGLPPTPAEADRFLADRSPGAYERMVDRYLASPRFGEEMARHWLDVARYADTHGLHLDNERHIWQYRDWVVKAFNRNLSFDQFTVEQLAGDLLPNPSPDQLVATGFNRCNVTTSEGGSIEPEWVYRYAVDRTATTAQAWLGLTAGCSQCHDHKYDPISQKEFYSLYAFFYSAADPGMDGNVSNTRPFLRVPTRAQQAAIDAATKKEAAARTEVDALAARVEYADPADEKPAPAKRAVTDVLFDDVFLPGAQARNTSRNATDWLDSPAFGAKSGRRVLRQMNSYYTEDVVTPQLVPVVVPTVGRVEAWVRPDPDRSPVAVALAVNGKRLWWGDETEDDSVFPGRAKDGRRGPLPAPGEWTKLSVPAEAFGLKPGQKVNTVAIQQGGGVTYWDSVQVTGEADPTTDVRASFRAWWKGIGAKAPAELPGELHAVATGGPDTKPAAEQAAKLRAFYLARIARPGEGELATARAALDAAKAARESAEDAAPGTMVFKDLDTPRDAFLMLRGQYDKPGEKVTPAVPAVLPPLEAAADARPTRLDLANWLVAPANPLTARVTVNRFWQQFFGTGLVRTSFDFGSQGEPPSHPELLDWLAVEFREGKWDVKRFVRLLVTSDAFRRDSRITPAARARDHANRLYACGPRFRLAAEQLRDNALFVSGLLDETMGGPGVKPYQPPNIWEPVGFGDSNTRYYLQDTGSALYRRSLYTFLKRTAPPPFLVNFDGPNREQFCTLRDRTNTPLQALQLMNDVQHFEAARALAERAIRDGGKSTVERVRFLYRVVLSRQPDADEAKVVSAAFDKQLALYRSNPEAAKKAARVGASAPKGAAPDAEVAAWAMVANLLLNLDETVNRN